MDGRPQEVVNMPRPRLSVLQEAVELSGGWVAVSLLADRVEMTSREVVGLLRVLRGRGQVEHRAQVNAEGVTTRRGGEWRVHTRCGVAAGEYPASEPPSAPIEAAP